MVLVLLSGVLPMSLAPVFATAFGRQYQLASLPQYYTYAGVFHLQFEPLNFTVAVAEPCRDLLIMLSLWPLYRSCPSVRLSVCLSRTSF